MIDWMDDARRRDLRALIPSLSSGDGGSRRRPGPCPSCGGCDVSVYGASDRTHERWHCHRCGSGGDAVDAVSHALCGRPFGGAACDTVAVREWFCGPGVEVREARPPPPPSYPDEVELFDLLSRCRAGGDGEAWIRSRGLRGDLPAGCLGTLPALAERRIPMPAWAVISGQDWQTAGNRYLVPLCDERGSVRSVRARRDDRRSAAPKCVPPKGHSVRGLWMASRWGREQLGRGFSGRVVVVEGEPAWLLAVTWWEPRGVLVLGFFAGSCTMATCRALSDCDVLVAVDDDPAGGRYVRSWSETLGRSVRSTTLKDLPWEWDP